MIFLGAQWFQPFSGVKIRHESLGSTWKFPSPTCTKQLRENVKDPPGYWDIGVSKHYCRSKANSMSPDASHLLNPLCRLHEKIADVRGWEFHFMSRILRWIWTRSCVNGKKACTLLPISVVTQLHYQCMKPAAWRDHAHICSLETYCMISTQFPSNHLPESDRPGWHKMHKHRLHGLQATVQS